MVENFRRPGSRRGDLDPRAFFLIPQRLEPLENVRIPGHLFQASDLNMEELLDEAMGELFDPRPLGRGELPQLGPEPFQLLTPERIGVLLHLRDQRPNLAISPPSLPLLHGLPHHPLRPRDGLCHPFPMLGAEGL